MRSAIKLSDVVRRTGLSKASVYRLAKAGRFPRPIKLSERSSGFIESEVDGWLADRVAERDVVREEAAASGRGA